MHEVTSKEKSLAAANHAASILFPLLGPVVFWAMSRGRSKFVEQHALTAIFEQLLLKLMLFIGGAASVIWTVVRVVQHVNEYGVSVSWDVLWPILLKMGVTWAFLGLLAIYLTAKSILQALQALDGKWPNKGLSAKLAARVSKS